MEINQELLEALKRSIEIVRSYHAEYEPMENDDNYFEDMRKLLKKYEGK